MQVSERRKTTISQELEKNGLQPTDDAVNSVAAIMGAKGINYQLAVKQFVAKCHSKVAGLFRAARATNQ